MTTDIIWHDRKRPIFGLPLSFTKYDLSNDRLFITTGFFTTVENELRLFRVLDVKLTKKLFQKMFGVGTILLVTSDKSLGTFEVKNIKRPDEIKEMISKLADEDRQKRRVGAREIMDQDDDSLDDER